MKKQTLKLLSFIALSAITTQAKAQWVAPFIGSSDIITDAPVSNVGIRTAIGSSVPFELTVNGEIGYDRASTANFFLGNSDDMLNIYGSTNNSNGAGIHLHSSTSATSNGAIEYIANGAPSTDIAHNMSIFDPFTSNSIDALSISKNGLVGINALNPIHTLTVNGTLGYSPTNISTRMLAGSTSWGMTFYSNSNNTNGSFIQLNSNGDGTIAGTLPSGSGAPGSIRFCIGDGSSNPSLNTPEGYTFMKYDGGSFSPLLTIQKDGKVAIGDAAWHTSPSGYKLYVQSGILTEKLVVTTMGGGNPAWPDYVFESDYKLKSLNDVEEYINKNKHLPEVPSAAEITQNGIDIAQMDANLLKKIEELTLYVIQQQKEINALKAKVNN